MRLPLAIPLDSRSGSSTVDARLTNAIVENYEGRLTVSKRPGLTELATLTGAANGVVCFNGSLLSLFGTAVYSGVGTVSNLYALDMDGTSGTSVFTNSGSGGTITGTHVLSNSHASNGANSASLTNNTYLDCGTVLSAATFNGAWTCSFDLYITSAGIVNSTGGNTLSPIIVEDSLFNLAGIGIQFDNASGGSVDISYFKDQVPEGVKSTVTLDAFHSFSFESDGTDVVCKIDGTTVHTMTGMLDVTGPLSYTRLLYAQDLDQWPTSVNRVFVDNFRFSTAVAPSSVGTVSSGTFDFAQSGSTTSLFFKTKSNAYTYNGTTVTAVSDVDYPASTCRGTAYLDGRVFVCTTKGKVYQSADEDFTSWAALDFISANTEPDEAVFLCKYRDYIMVLKQWSCEFFYDAANATGSILAPVRNMFQLIGCASENTVRQMAGTVVWMGKTKDGEGRSIYMMAGSEPQPISTPQVDRLLDADDLSTVSSWSARLGSHQFYGINLSSISLAYDFSSGLWSRFTYLVASGVTKTISAITTAGVVTSTAHGYSDGDIIKVSSTNASWDGWHVVTTVSTNAYSIQGTGTAFTGSGTSEKHTEGLFPIEQSTSCGGKQIMQADGKLYEFLQDTTTDPIGAIASRVRTVKFDGGANTRKTFGEVEIVGDKVADYAVMRHSDDDFKTFSRSRPVDLSLNRSRLRRMGDANRRAFEILHVGDSAIRLEALEISAEG